MAVIELRSTLTLPPPPAAPSLSQRERDFSSRSHWEREGAREAQPSGKGEGSLEIANV